tara:strand:+ start:868 stop:1257 length:390 start_codon:yes stop_codon:yes gene_type:complete
MATVSITIQVSRADYPSLQVGDIAFYATPNDDVAGFKNADENDITKIGDITSINNSTSLDDGTQTTTLICNISTSTAIPTMSDFIFFAKDNKVNLTSLLGYYALVKFKNASGSKAEMFSAACEIHESSK